MRSNIDRINYTGAKGAYLATTSDYTKYAPDSTKAKDDLAKIEKDLVKAEENLANAEKEVKTTIGFDSVNIPIYLENYHDDNNEDIQLKIDNYHKANTSVQELEIAKRKAQQKVDIATGKVLEDSKQQLQKATQKLYEHQNLGVIKDGVDEIVGQRK